DTTVPTVAIFADGRAYHAVPARNRLAEDAEKRAILRDTGRIVLAITLQDLLDSARDAVTPPDWDDAALPANLLPVQSLQASPGAYAALGRGPSDWLIDWVSAPAPADVAAVARAIPMFMAPGAAAVRVPDNAGLAGVARSILYGEPVSGGRSVQVNRSGP